MMIIQHNLTKILDKANAIHSKRQEAIKLSNAFRRSVFLEMFGDPISNPKGWEIRQLSDLGLIVYGVPVGVFFNKLDYSSEADIPIVAPKNIHPFQFVTDALKFISREKLNTLTILPGDILLGTIGTTIGNVCLFPSLFEKAVLSNGVGKITPNNHVINTIYLSNHLFLLKDEMMKQTLGSTLPVLKIGTLKGLKILLPPLALQEKFAKIMQTVENLRAHLEQQQREHLLHSLTQNR